MPATTKQMVSSLQSKSPISIPEWLPPRDEWDFRSVTSKQCRLACLWEYARSDNAIISDPEGWHLGRGGKMAKGANTILGHYLMCNLGVLEPWVRIHDLQHNLFSGNDLKNLSSFATKLKQGGNLLDQYLWRNLTPQTRREIGKYLSSSGTALDTATTVIDDLNQIIKRGCIYTKIRFTEVRLESVTTMLLNRKVKEPEDVIRLNRMLIEDAYPDEIARGRAWQPQDWKVFDVWSSGGATRIRPLPEVKQKIIKEVAAGGELAIVLDRHLANIGYVLITDLFYGKTKDILDEFKSWVSEEKKKFPDRPKGRASEPPFEKLRWLSAYRLEQARRPARGNLFELQAFLREENRKKPSGAPTLPIYYSHGAWTKAVGDATKCLKRLRRSPARFELEILF